MSTEPQNRKLSSPKRSWISSTLLIAEPTRNLNYRPNNLGTSPFGDRVLTGCATASVLFEGRLTPPHARLVLRPAGLNRTPSVPPFSDEGLGEHPPPVKDRSTRPHAASSQPSALVPRLCRPVPSAPVVLDWLPPFHDWAFAPLPPKNAARVSRKGPYSELRHHSLAATPDTRPGFHLYPVGAGTIPGTGTSSCDPVLGSRSPAISLPLSQQPADGLSIRGLKPPAGACKLPRPLS